MHLCIKYDLYIYPPKFYLISLLSSLAFLSKYTLIQYSMFDLVAVLNVEDGVALVLLLQLRLQQQRHLVHVQQTVTV